MMKPIHFELEGSPITVNNINVTKEHVHFNVHWTKDKDNDFNYIIKAEVEAAKKVGEAIDCELGINGGTGTEYYRSTSCRIQAKAKKEETSKGFITWDYKEQIDIDELNTILKNAGFKGSVREIDLHNDQYGILVTPTEVTKEQAQDLYDYTEWGDDPMGSWMGQNE